MQNNAMIFTVADTENAGKPIVWAQSASSVHVNDQEKAEELIRDWAEKNLELYGRGQLEFEIEDVAYSMRKEGHGWFAERWCFELTEVWG